MAWTRTDFYANFPAFDLTDYTATPVPAPNAAADAVVDSAIALAKDLVDASVFNTAAIGDRAQQLYAAHYLATQPGSRFARLQKSRGDDNLVTSEDIYWKEFEMLGRIACGGPRVL